MNQPLPNPSASATNVSFNAWLNRHYKPVLATLALLVVSVSVYAFFLRSNPQVDGKSIAKAYCECEKHYLQEQIQVKQKYLEQKTHSPAQKAQLTAALMATGQVYTSCRQQVKERESEQRGAYIGDESAKSEFDQALSEQIALWYASESDQVAALDKSLVRAGFSHPSLLPIPSQLKPVPGSVEADATEALSSSSIADTQETIASGPMENIPATTSSENIGHSAVVESAKAFFYTSSSLSQSRKSYCVKGDQLLLRETAGDAVSVTYTATTGKQVRGWMSKKDLTILPSESQDRAAVTAEDLSEENPETSNLIGTWTGTLGEKPFTLHIDAVKGNKLTGWNQVGNNRRPVSGAYSNIHEEGSSVYFEMTLREPGTDKWDGKFELMLTSPMAHAAPTYCSGEWTSYKGNLSKEVTANKEYEE